MSDLLGAIKEFDPVLRLSGSLTSEETKRRIMKFLEPFNSGVEEVLFYFSGHGSVIREDLAFAMTDYNEAHRVSGSLTNGELDSYLRSVTPTVAVKILDCCHSGIPYVKGIDEPGFSLTRSRDRFNNCYFFSSSRFDQESWTGSRNNDLSLFTGYFLMAVAEQEDGPVRYKQLDDSISNRFAEERQEPQFLYQGSLKHVFCTMNSEIRQAALGRLPASSVGAVEEQQPSGQLIDALSVVRGREKYLIPKGQADEILTELRMRLEKMPPDERLSAFYDEELRFPALLEDDLAGEDAIGRWLKHEGRGFFGWATETDPNRRPLSAVSMALGYTDPPQVTGFVSSAEVEYDRVFLRQVPKFGGLTRWEMAVVILWSPWRAGVFSYEVKLQRRSWDRFDQPEKAPWVRRMFPRSDLETVPDYVIGRVTEYRNGVASYLERFAQRSS